MSPAFEHGERISTLRLEIAAIEAADLVEAPWSLAAIGLAASLPISGRRRFLAIRQRTGGVIGCAVVSLDRPEEGAATFDYIAIAPEHRYCGLGGEAGIAIERHLRTAGYERIFAAVPDNIGLAVYFWLRLGLHPLLLSEAPPPFTELLPGASGGIWMVRDWD